MHALQQFSRLVGKTFALWAALFACLGFFFPAAFTWVQPIVVYLLGIVMFGMGLTLRPRDFKILTTQPKAVLIGIIAQFAIMPSLAFLLAKLFALPAEIAAGLILVGSCPGGTSSNVMTYLARGNIALSVGMTSVTTLLAPLLTPAVFWLFARQWLDINAMGMLITIVKIVLLPVFLGVLAHSYFRRQTEAATQVLPLVSVTAIALIIAGVVAVSRNSIMENGLLIFAVVILHNALGYLMGFVVAKLAKLPYDAQKTVAIEVGMQNSGLGATLAKVHFALYPVVAVPSALFSVWHNISGALLANYWASKDRQEAEQAQRDTLN